jgi:hypothetical protein
MASVEFTITAPRVKSRRHTKACTPIRRTPVIAARPRTRPAPSTTRPAPSIGTT